MINGNKVKINNDEHWVNTGRVLSLFMLFLFLILSFIVGNRSLDIGDTSRYLNIFNKVFEQELRVSEPFFIYLVGAIEKFTGSFTLLLIVISFVSIVSLYSFYIKIGFLGWKGGGNKYWIFVLLVMIVTFLSPFFWNAQVNVIRSGIAIPFLLLSVYHLYLKNYMLYMVFAFSAIMFHYSSLVFVLSTCALLFFSKRLLIIFFLILTFLYIVGFWEAILTALISALNIDFLKGYMNYITRQGDYKSGVRLDFLAFTVFFALLIFFVDHGKKSTILSDFLLKSYAVLTYPFLLIGFISYSDRLLLSVWFLIPPVVACFIVSYLKPNYSFVLLPVLVFVFLLMLLKRGLIIAF